MASNQRQRREPAGRQRLALLAFAGAFVLLFVGFAIAQGIGNPSVASGDVAVIEDAPDDLGAISEADLEHAIAQAAGQAGTPVPKPGEKQYEELQETAFGELLDRIWIQGEAEEMGISVTPKEVSAELEKLKEQAFKTEAQYQKFLKEAHFTQADVDERVKVQVLTEQIQKQITAEAPAPSSDEIEEYYEAAKSAQFTKPETREARAVLYKDKGEAEKAKAELEKDDSVATWKRLAAKSDNSSTKKTGGLLKGVTNGGSPEPLNAALFAAPAGQVEGLLKGQSGYTVFEVEKVNPETAQSLEEAKAQISAQLAEQAQQQTFARFIGNYGSTWKSRTFCASGFTIERCSNFKGDGRPPEANPACYEADPKGGPPEACPAPVGQVKPALPGTVDVLTPEGEKLAQRPQPSATESSAEAPGLTGAPPVAPGE